MKKITIKNKSSVDEKINNECPDCGSKCCTISEIHPSPMLKCPKCGKLIENPNYDVSFIGYH